MEENLQTLIGDGKVRKIPCFMYGCKLVFTAADVEKFGSKQIYLKYLKFKENIDVDLDPNLRWCGAKGCLKYVKRGKGKQRDKVTCECGNTLCFKCGGPWHEGACPRANDSEYLSWARNMDGACTNCPKCHARIEKIPGGCNHLTCQ